MAKIVNQADVCRLTGFKYRCVCPVDRTEKILSGGSSAPVIDAKITELVQEPKFARGYQRYCYPLRDRPETACPA